MLMECEVLGVCILYKNFTFILLNYRNYSYRLVEFCTDVKITTKTPDTGTFMNRSSPRGIKLTTVIFAVIVLAVSAALSNISIAGDKDVTLEQSVNEQ
jgi:hypothetical protein